MGSRSTSSSLVKVQKSSSYLLRMASWILVFAVASVIITLLWDRAFNDQVHFTTLCLWLFNTNMNNSTCATPSTFYYIVSTLGIYHSYSDIVNTTLGKVQGIRSVSRDGREFFEFRGIPFAESPDNELRFKPPVPKRPWDPSLYTADSHGPPCLQFDAMVKGEVIGEENCLRLHIYTPELKPKKLKSVIAYIHGGGFTSGEAAIYNPKYLMDTDCIVVTFNYRVGSLGFLNSGDSLVRGNMGFKDQVLALKFIRDNIEAFGGDRTRVTLMGESAGGASTHYHVISPLSRGLFQKAIIQSGSVASPWALTRNPQHQALRFGKLCNCPVENTTVLVDCLRRMDARDIVKHHVEIMSPVHKQDDFFPGSVEAVQDDDTFLGENPYVMLERGDFAHIPVIFGINSGEGGLKTARLEAYSEILDELDTKWNKHIPVLMHYDPNRTEVSNKLREYYFSNKSEENNNATVFIDPAKDLYNLTKMLGLGIFFEPNQRAANLHAKFAPTYLYYYTHISQTLPSAYKIIRAAQPKKWYAPWEYNVGKGVVAYYANKLIWGSDDEDYKFAMACHGDDVMQVFSMNSIMDIKTTSSDYAFSKDLVNTIFQFTSSTDLSDLSFKNVTWPAMKLNDTRPKYMKLGNYNGELIDEPFTEDAKFIQNLQIRDPFEPNNW